MKDEEFPKGRIAIIKVWKTKVKKTQRKTVTEKIQMIDTTGKQRGEEQSKQAS